MITQVCTAHWPYLVHDQDGCLLQDSAREAKELALAHRPVAPAYVPYHPHVIAMTVPSRQKNYFVHAPLLPAYVHIDRTFGDLTVQAAGLCLHALLQMYMLQRRPNLIVCALVERVQIAAHRARKQHRILRD